MDASPFSLLPRELRDLIYTHTFTTPADRAITLQPSEIQHPLTRTCRALREETLQLYFSLTRFNAHLDDGPATPLARWLVAMGTERCRGLREVNVWDMHMLNGVLHGERAAEGMLRDGPTRVEASALALSGSEDRDDDDDGHVDDEDRSTSCSYILRPIGRDIFHGSWYLSEIVLALQSINLQLRRFCEVQHAPSSSPFDHPSNVKQTSHFAIQPCSPNPSRLGLVNSFGLDGLEQEVLLQRLQLGEREIRLPVDGRRSVVFAFDEEGGRLVGMRQEAMPMRREETCL